jgi:chromosome segregation ATPase
MSSIQGNGIFFADSSDQEYLKAKHTSSLNKTINEQNIKISDLQTQLTNSGKKVVKWRNEALKFSNTNDLKDNEIETSIREKELFINEKTNTISIKDREIQELNSIINKLRNEILNLNSSVNSKDNEIQTLNGTIITKKNQITDLENTINNNNTLIQQKNTRIDRKNNQIQEITNQLNEVSEERNTFEEALWKIHELCRNTKFPVEMVGLIRNTEWITLAKRLCQNKNKEYLPSCKKFAGFPPL